MSGCVLKANFVFVPDANLHLTSTCVLNRLQYPLLKQTASSYLATSVV